MFGLLDYGALTTLGRLRVPDALTRWTTVDDLARRLDVQPASLERLLRYGVSRGWLRIDRRGRFGPNAVTRFLAPGHPGGWSKWLDFFDGAEVVAAVGALSDAVRTGGDAFTIANGSSFFEWMEHHPERLRAFDGAMATGARMHGLALAATIDWSKSQRVCDVAGGDGSLLRILLERHRNIEGVLFDLPQVVANARPADRLEIRSGDAFVEIPKDCDTYLFVNIVHDWGDDDVVRLLSRVVDDGPARARVLVVDGVRKRQPTDDIPGRTDLFMLALAPGGRERSLEEFARLGARAGLRLERAIPLVSTDYALVFHGQE